MNVICEIILQAQAGSFFQVMPTESDNKFLRMKQSEKKQRIVFLIMRHAIPRQESLSSPSESVFETHSRKRKIIQELFFACAHLQE